MMRVLITLAIAGSVEVSTFQRMSAHYMAEYLTANFLLCLVAFWFAWEIVEA